MLATVASALCPTSTVSITDSERVVLDRVPGVAEHGDHGRGGRGGHLVAGRDRDRRRPCPRSGWSAWSSRAAPARSRRPPSRPRWQPDRQGCPRPRRPSSASTAPGLRSSLRPRAPRPTRSLWAYSTRTNSGSRGSTRTCSGSTCRTRSLPPPGPPGLSDRQIESGRQIAQGRLGRIHRLLVREHDVQRGLARDQGLGRGRVVSRRVRGRVGRRVRRRVGRRVGRRVRGELRVTADDG